MERIKVYCKDYLLFIVIVVLLYGESIEGTDNAEEKPRIFKERRRHENQYNNDDGFDENFIALAPDETGVFSFDEIFNSQLLVDANEGDGKNQTNTSHDSINSGKISYHIVYDEEEEVAAAAKADGRGMTHRKNNVEKPASTSTTMKTTTTRKSVILSEDTQDYDVMMDDSDVDYRNGNHQKLKSSYNSIHHNDYDGENDGKFVDVITTPPTPLTTPSTTTTTTTVTMKQSPNRYNQYLLQLQQQERPQLQQRQHKKDKPNYTKSHKKHHQKPTQAEQQSRNNNNNKFDYRRQGIINFYDSNNFYDSYQSDYHKPNHNSDKWPHLTKVTKNLNREEQYVGYVPPYVKKFNRRNKQLNELLDGSSPVGHRRNHKRYHNHHKHHHHKHHHHRDDWIENLFEEQKPNHTVTFKTTIHPNELPDDGVHVIYDKSHYEKETAKTNKYEDNLQTNNNNYFNAKTSNFVYHRVEQPPAPAGTFGRMKKQRLPYVAITDRKLGPPRGGIQRRSISSSDSISSISSSSNDNNSNNNNNNNQKSRRRK